jgi:hypothetical protein
MIAMKGFSLNPDGSEGLPVPIETALETGYTPGGASLPPAGFAALRPPAAPPGGRTLRGLRCGSSNRGSQESASRPYSFDPRTTMMTP